jgi:prophage tail gpP-like protein
VGAIGQDHDRVTITLAEKTVLVAKSYDIQQSAILQPSSFGLQLGSATEARHLMKEYPPGTPFKLAVDDVIQFVGQTDGYVASSRAGTDFTLRGRDTLAFLHGAFARSDRTFSDITYAELVEQVLTLADPKREWVLGTSNADNRKAVSRSQATSGGGDAAAAEAAVGELGDDSITAQLAEDATARAPSQQSRTLRIKAGDRLYPWLKAELDRAGLMLWAAADGSFILSAPDTEQAACARITRKRGDPAPMVKEGAFHRNEITDRYSECIVHMRRGGGAEPRGRGYGAWVDEEMKGYGIDRPLVLTDKKCKTLAQADIMARRLIAESRRASWQLQYPLPGHTVVGLRKERVILNPDMVVEVDDDEFGIRGLFYLESVNKSRRSETEMICNLMRLADVLYGTEGEGENT